jgi:hypothetical protein
MLLHDMASMKGPGLPRGVVDTRRPSLIDSPEDRVRPGNLRNMMHDEFGQGHDVFLSHNSADKAIVEKLAAELRQAGFSAFLDSESLNPGESWVPGLEMALQGSRVFMFCVGPSDPGRWTMRELHAALHREAREPSFAVIPVLLPEASHSHQEEISLFLSQHQSLDLRRGISKEGMARVLDVLRKALSGELKRRRVLDSPAPAQVEPVLERLQSRFAESVRHHLAGGLLIQRKETRELIALLEDEATRIVVVHGIAGSGKSGVLFEFARELSEQGISFLPLRLDRHELRGNPKRFGTEALDLPSSPARSLAAISAGKKGGILLLDQLDALRWTSAHSSEAWDVCREINRSGTSGYPEEEIQGVPTLLERLLIAFFRSFQWRGGRQRSNHGS